MKFSITTDIASRAAKDTRMGVKIQMTPLELIAAMDSLDSAMNAKHLKRLDIERFRETLSEWFEDPARRTAANFSDGKGNL